MATIKLNPFSRRWKIFLAVCLTIIGTSIFVYGYYNQQQINANFERTDFLRSMITLEEQNRLCTFRHQLGFLRDCMSQFNNYTYCNEQSFQFVYGFNQITRIDVNGTEIHWIVRCYNVADINKTVDYILETDSAHSQMIAERLQAILNATSSSISAQS